MLLSIFAYSLVPTILLLAVVFLVRARILVIVHDSCLSKVLGLILVLSVLTTATTGAILLAQSVLT